MKSIRRIISSILCVVLILTAAPLSGFVGLELPAFSDLFSTKAEAATYSGVYSDTSVDGLTWSVNTETQELIINGEGSIWDYTLYYDNFNGKENYYTNAPWFKYRDYIVNVTVEDGITDIGDNAFAYCYKLSNISFSGDLKRIGTDALLETAIYNEESNWISNCFYVNDYLISVDKTIYGSYTIREGTTLIADHAFLDCSRISSVVIPASVCYIGRYAFLDCFGLLDVRYNGDIASWCQMYFHNKTSNPKYYAKNLHIDNNIISGSINIPNGVSVNQFAFYNFDEITLVNFSVVPQFIGYCAFYDCDNLEKVTFFATSILNREKANIETSAFESCNSLSEVKLLAETVYIGDDAFRSCTSLTNITLRNKTEVASQFAFYDTGYYNDSENWENGLLYIGSHLIAAKTSIAGECTIKQDTMMIVGSAFFDCVNVQKVYMPDSVVFLGDAVFEDCSSLMSVTLSNNVESISKNCFKNCTALQSIEITDSVETIEEEAFNGCSSLVSVKFGANVNVIREESFANCKKIESLIFNEGLNTIEKAAFMGCSQLKQVSFYEGLTEIGYRAFYKCVSLISLNLPLSMTILNSYSFESCSNLEKVTFSDKLIKLGVGTFKNCTRLVDFMIPNSVQEIGEYAFEGTGYYNDENNWSNGVLYKDGCLLKFKNSNLDNYSIIDGTVIIADNAFANQTNLININIPDSVKYIGELAFYKTGFYNNSNNWKNGMLYISNHLIDVNSNVTGECVIMTNTKTIAFSAFDGCIGIERIYFGNGLKNIFSNTFEECSNLKEVHFGESIEYIDHHAFKDFCGTFYGFKDSGFSDFIGRFLFADFTFVYYDNSVELVTNEGVLELDWLGVIGGKIVVPFRNPMLETKTFTGWYDTPDGGTLYTAESVVNEDITLYANWTDRKILKQTVITPPAKTSYFVGDEFILDGYEVEIEYDNGFTKTYNKDNLTVLASTLTEAGEQTVSVQADEFVIEIPVEVIPIKASSISVSKLPVKTEYVTGQRIDTTGLELKIVNNNGTTEYVTDGFELVNDAVYSVGTNEVQVMYEEVTTYFNVNVVEILPAKLSVSKMPDKTFYSTDEQFDTKGLELTVTYNNGTTKVLSSLTGVNIEYEFSLMNPIVTFTYTERGKTLICTIDVGVYESPEIYLENASSESGGTIGVPVYIKGNCGLMGFKFQMIYNADIFIPQSVTWALDSGNKEDSIGSNSSGTVDIAWSGNENYTADGLLFTVNFKVADHAVGDYDFGISCSSDNVYNEKEELVKLSCTGSTISVVKPSLPDVMTIYIDPIVAENGTKIDVPVKLHKNTGLGVSVINIVYDSNALTPVSVTSGMSTVLSENSSSANGNLQIILLATDAGLGDGTLFNIKFDVSDSAAGEYPLALNCVGQTTQNGLITVNNASLSANTKIYADDVSAKYGETVKMPVYISNNQGIMGMNIRFCFDPDVLKLIDVTKGNVLTSGTFDSGILTDENQIVISWYDSSDFIGNGEIAILEFEVLAESAVGTLIEVTYSQDDTFNENWEDVILECENINVVVTSDLLAAKPGTTTVIEYGLIYGLDCGLDSLDDYVVVDNSYNLEYNGNKVLGSGSVVSVTYNGEKVMDYTILIFGDVNGDGWYDGMDAVIVSCLESGMLTKDDVGEAVYMAADCNHDGVIDQLDVDLLNQAGSLLANVDQSKPAEILLETSSEYVEYISLIDQSPEIEDEKTEGVPEVDVESEDTTPEQDYAEVNIFEMIINFIKSIFELLFAYIPVPIN